MLTVLGRREDAIRKKGALTLPSTIEDAVLAMPGVAEAGVVGVPEHGEQKVLVAVVPRQGVELTPEAVTAHLTSLPPAAWPDLVVIADELPHANDASGGRGKLLRREIRTRWAGRSRRDQVFKPCSRSVRYRLAYVGDRQLAVVAVPAGDGGDAVAGVPVDDAGLGVAAEHALLDALADDVGPDPLHLRLALGEVGEPGEPRQRQLLLLEHHHGRGGGRRATRTRR